MSRMSLHVPVSFRRQGVSRRDMPVSDSAYGFSVQKTHDILEGFPLDGAVKRVEETVFGIPADLPLRRDVHPIVHPDDFPCHGGGKHMFIFRFEKKKRRVVSAQIVSQ